MTMAGTDPIAGTMTELTDSEDEHHGGELPRRRNRGARRDPPGREQNSRRAAEKIFFFFFFFLKKKKKKKKKAHEAWDAAMTEDDLAKTRPEASGENAAACGKDREEGPRRPWTASGTG